MVAFSMTKDSPLSGGVLVFGANWDRKQGKQSDGGKALSRLTRGKLNLGGKPKEVDLDLGVVFYRDGAAKRLLIGWNPEAVSGGTHTGDNQTGDGENDEVATVDLDRLPAWITELAVVISTKPTASFGNAQNVGVKVFEGELNPANEVDELMPDLGSTQNISVVATAKRNKNAKGDPIDGWTTRLVDKSGRYHVSPGESTDDGILRFVKQNAGL